MARNIPFLLEMGDGKKVRTIEELREHFDLETVRSYYADGRLIRWLKTRDYEEEAEKIEDLNPHLDSFEESLCEVLGVRYEPFLDYKMVSYTAVENKNRRREVVRQFTADDKILASAENIAFTQEELRNLLEKGRKVIYLCGKQFVISGDVEDISYIGINTPTIILENRKVKKGIDISGVEFDLCNYMEAAISNIYTTIKNDLINGDLIYDDDDCPTEDEFWEMINTMDNTDKFTYYFMDNPQLCVKLLKMVTKESGVAQAQFVLSWCYTEGFGTEENIDESIRCLQYAAELGLAEAQESLGYRYLYGKDVQKNVEEAIKWFYKAAEQGNIDAQCDLGNCYFQGEYIEKNIEKAIKWFQKAAEQGNGFAQNNLGLIYMSGNGVEANYAESIKWFQKANEQGEPLVLDNMFECYRRYMQDDVENAIRWIQKCAEQKDVYAQLVLGICYANGKGLEENDEDAVKWYQEAADQGLALAMRMLGDCYYKGKGVERNPKEAVRWYREAAAKGDAGAKNGLGNCYFYGEGVEENDEEAVKWYREAAAQGSAEAQCGLGKCYEEGYGVEQNPKEAVRWYREAANKGEVDAQYALAYCYVKGIGVEQNLKEAVRWYREIAVHGNASVQCVLGDWYIDGIGVEKNDEEAVRWYREAAVQGEPDAQFRLGACYKYGFVVNKDITEAIKWLSQSFKQGNEMAKTELIEIAPQLFTLSEVILYAVDGEENLHTNKEAKLDKGMGTIDIPVCQTDLIKEAVLKEFGAISVSIENEYYSYNREKPAGKKILAGAGVGLVAGPIGGIIGGLAAAAFAKPEIETKYIKQANGWLHIKFSEISTEMEEDFDQNIKSFW